jgi:hypothetical protein
MDTMKLLLGATIALLLGALAVSWQGMKTGVKSAPPDEIARLEKQVKELRAEQDKLQLEKQMIQLRGNAGNTPAASSAAADLAAIRAQMEAQAAARGAEEAEARAKRDAKTADAEELELDKRGIEKKDVELKRARNISQALLIGRIREYVESPQGGDFVTFDVLLPEQVQIGAIVAIRRKTGILGQLKVSDVTTEGAIANPLPGFGPVKPQVGDELILPPQY